MALPRKDDPRRPLHLAVWIMRILGGVLLLMATCIGSILGANAREWAAGRNAFPLWNTVVAILCYGGVGVVLVVLAAYLKRRNAWAVSVSIGLASLGVLLMVLVTIVISIRLARGALLPDVWISYGIILLMLGVLVQLIYQLTKSFKAIRYMPPDERGFEPLMPPPARNDREPPAEA